VDLFPANGANGKNVVRILCMVLLAMPLFGDAGAVLLRDREHDIEVVLVAEPAPLRVGPAFFRAYLRNVNGAQLPNGTKVSICGINASGKSMATRRTMEFSAPVILARAGPWTCLVHIESQGTTLELPATVAVLGPEDPLRSYWAYFALPPVGALLFALNRRLKHTAPSVASK
jgi:hypothetical protein